LFGLL